MRELADDHAARADRYRRVAEAIEKGNIGEHKIASLLDVLDGAGWFVLNDRYKSKNSRANIDHILVGPPGVCVIDSKNWNSGQLRLDDRGMALGKYRRDDQLAGVKAQATVVEESARAVVPGAITAPVVAFASDVGLRTPQYHHGVMCMQAEQLLPWLTAQPTHLSPQQVHQLASSLDASFPPRSGAPNPFTLAELSSAPPAQGARNPGRRPSSVRARPPRSVGSLTGRAGDVAIAGVQALTSWLARVTIALILVALVITVGVPLMTKALQSAIPRMLPTAQPSPFVVAPAHPAPPRPGQSIVTPRHP
jgi:hypothetical protein